MQNESINGKLGGKSGTRDGREEVEKHAVGWEGTNNGPSSRDTTPRVMVESRPFHIESDGRLGCKLSWQTNYQAIRKLKCCPDATSWGLSMPVHLSTYKLAYQVWVACRGMQNIRELLHFWTQLLELDHARRVGEILV